MSTQNAARDTQTETEQQTPRGVQTTQTEIGAFHNPVPTISTDDDGRPIPPVTVGEYVEQDSFKDAHYKSPATIHTDPGHADKPPIKTQQFRHVVVDSLGGDAAYTVYTSVGDGRPTSSRLADGIIAEVDNAMDAHEAAVEWMTDNPVNGEEIDRTNPPIPSDSIHDHSHTTDDLDAIRDGSQIMIDSLPPVTVNKVPEESDEPYNWIGRTDADTVVEIYTESTGYSSARLTYNSIWCPDDAFIEAERVTISNEDNLRDAVDAELYSTLKSHAECGTPMIRITGDHQFEVIEIESIRDGYVNPNDGAIDPDDHRVSGIHITDDESGQWVTLSTDLDLEDGTYNVTTQGVIKTHDTYALGQCVDAETWDNADIIATDSAPDPRADLNTELPNDTDTLKRHDPITEITGIGAATSAEVFRDKIGELYEAGWPVPYISDQYVPAAVAQLYTIHVGGETDVTDAARAVTGMLGGCSFDADGTALGTAASGITGSYTPDNATSGWLHNTSRIDDEFTPNWFGQWTDSTNDDGTVLAFGAGAISQNDVSEYLDTNSVDATQVEAEMITEHTMNGDVVALTSADADTHAVTVNQQALETAASITQTSADELRSERVTVWETNANDHTGIIHITDPDTDISAVIDTSETLTPDDMEEHTAA